ncbi:MAG: DUF5615 family PIN-like protein [Pseudolabrys sp.]
MHALERADDHSVWQFARANNYTIVSLDADFVEMATLLGHPPKVIWLRQGNRPTAPVEVLLRNHAELISTFDSGSVACLEIY